MAENSMIIWLIEDNDVYREAALRVIRKIDGVTAARGFRSCEPALAAMEADEKPPTIVLTDLGLPGMGGLEGIRRLKEQAPTVQVLVLTVFDDAEKVFDAICAGADGYLLKATTFHGLSEAIAEVRAGGAPMNGRIARLVLQRFARQSSPQPDYGLTDREKEVLEAMVRGLIKKEIAAELNLSVHTVDFHLRHIYEKLQVNTRTAAVAKAVRERLT